MRFAGLLLLLLLDVGLGAVLNTFADCEGQSGHAFQWLGPDRCLWFTDESKVAGPPHPLCGTEGLPFAPLKATISDDQVDAYLARAAAARTVDLLELHVKTSLFVNAQGDFVLRLNANGSQDVPVEASELLHEVDVKFPAGGPHVPNFYPKLRVAEVGQFWHQSSDDAGKERRTICEYRRRARPAGLRSADFRIAERGARLESRVSGETEALVLPSRLHCARSCVQKPSCAVLSTGPGGQCLLSDRPLGDPLARQVGEDGWNAYRLL